MVALYIAYVSCESLIFAAVFNIVWVPPSFKWSRLKMFASGPINPGSTTGYNDNTVSVSEE